MGAANNIPLSLSDLQHADCVTVAIGESSGLGLASRAGPSFLVAQPQSAVANRKEILVVKGPLSPRLVRPVEVYPAFTL